MPTQVVNDELVDLLRPWFCEKPCLECPYKLCSPDMLINPLLLAGNDGSLTWYGNGGDGYFIFDTASSPDRYFFFDGTPPGDLITSRYINFYTQAGNDVAYFYNYLVDIDCFDNSLVWFHVTGKSEFDSDVEFGNDITVFGSGQIMGDLGVNGNVAVTGTLTVG